MSKTVLHKAETRGHVSLGWLNTHHTFSFSNYHNPERMHFGSLRVLNDDVVEGGRGFGMHPHENMEIVTIPLSGDLQHSDSMGNTEVIRTGDVQIMSAGTGIYHSEVNPNPDKPVSLFQIWVFPKLRDIEPRYAQKTYSAADRANKLQTVVAPDDEAAVWINQDAWFALGNFSAGNKTSYTIRKPGNGVYAMVISGDVTVDNQQLHARDGIGVWDTDAVEISADSDAEILVMDLPMTVR